MIRPAPVEVELGYRAHWLVQLRWIASSAIIYGTFITTSLLGLRFDPVPAYFLGAAVAIYNSLFIIALKWSEVGSDDSRANSARLLTNGQIVADLAVLTLLIHFTGGAENPLAFYFVFHVVVASILLSRREAFRQATLACLLYGGLLVLELSGVVPHVHVLGSPAYDLAHDRQYVAVVLAVFASTLYLSAYLATSIVAKLRQRHDDVLRLSAELERKAGELERTFNDLARLEEIKSRQIRNIAHEVKPPLTSIQTLLRSLLDGSRGELTTAQRETISQAEARTGEMLALVSDLLLLSRVREARLLTERKAVDLADLASRVVAAQAPTAAERGVELRLEPRPLPEATVLGDEEALRQAVSQLVSNAVSYTLAGGKVQVRLEALGEVIRLEVSDTGIGIPPADVPKVFNEFFRAENARRYREEGTGLGLSIARSIVEGHGGQIELESRLGAGTTLSVLLPAAREEQARMGRLAVGD